MSDPRMDINSPYFNCVTREEYEKLKAKCERLKEICKASTENNGNLLELMENMRERYKFKIKNEKQAAFNKGYRECASMFILSIATIISVVSLIVVLTQ